MFLDWKPPVKFKVSDSSDDLAGTSGYTVSMMERIGRLKPVRYFIAEWREARDLTQDQLAERIDSTKGTISKLENGDMKMSPKWQAAIAYALGLEPEDLLHHPDMPTPNQLLRHATDEQRALAVRLIQSIFDNPRKAG
jgi:transcriptional regulator with XRE-family HTH domain